MSAQQTSAAPFGVPWRDAAVLALLWLLVVCTPFPLGQTGAIQLSHVALILLVIISITRPVILELPAAALLLWALFTGYFLSVAAIWSSLLASLEPIVYALPIGLGVVTFLTILVEMQRNALRVVSALRDSCVIALLIQGVLLVTSGLDFTGDRGLLFFTNPNQLAYFALLAGSIFLACHHIRGDGRLEPMLMVAVLVSVLVLYSRSKAGIVALAFFLILGVVRQKKGRLVLALSIGLVFLAALPLLIEIVTEIVPRFLRLPAARDESLAGRGYDRIWRYSQYLFFGAGEGVFRRFKGIYDVEIHATVASFVFSYGIVGTLLGLVAIAASVSRSLVGFLYLGPAMIYGLAHNGIRQPLFWILLAVAVSFRFSSLVITARRDQRGGRGLYVVCKKDYGRIKTHG